MSNDEQSHRQDSAIPLLEDVVSTDKLESEHAGHTNNDREMEDSGVPEYDEVLLGMRDEIAKQLMDDLRLKVAEAVKQAITETTTRIGQILHDELDSSLERRIRHLIEQRLETEFGPRHQHSSDNEDSDPTNGLDDDKP
ncbi:MAG: hypothetical protein KZQ88_17365 [Candidatus Thiodiazotropha sp. (ex Dulcina madagascariensis)]|nr:hypothetical protein [Candidatus Thiodiazotropha sp. (ex Dulcina madagascariensis)]MCU7928351.1 hypothetical protein [Candidatus Thiodiazotropha sp. (ex Dulcina madagascariensis)]